VNWSVEPSGNIGPTCGVCVIWFCCGPEHCYTCATWCGPDCSPVE
jgi:hypothetical protein